MMKLKKVRQIEGKINILTGLHIGASNEIIEIGGMDNPIIKDPLRLSLRTRQRPVVFHFDIATDEYLPFNLVLNNLPDMFVAIVRILHALGTLNLDGHVVFSAFVFPEKDDLVFAADLFDIGEYLVDVARVDIDGPEDKHIIGATQYPVMSRHHAAAGTFSRHDLR